MTTWAVEKWKRERSQQVVKSTVNRKLTFLKHVFKMGVTWGLMTANPAASVFPTQRGGFPIAHLTDAHEKS
jgi:hypothetical protein